MNIINWIFKLKQKDLSQSKKIKNLTKQIKQLNKNNNGLSNQHNIDIADKEYLKTIVEQKQQIINIANIYIDPKRLIEYKNHITATKEITKIEKNTNSKNN